MGIDTRRENEKGVEEMEVCGYPGDKECRTMWHAFGPFLNVTEQFINYQIPTTGGQSGSPVIKREGGKEFIIGVHIGGLNKNNVAVRLTPERRNTINEWVGEITGRLFLSKLVVT